MSDEFKTYLLMIALLIVFWLCGAIVDTSMWGHQTYMTPRWFIRNMHFFWLFLNQGLLPLLIVWLLKPKANTLLAFFTAGAWGSAGWDMLYGYLTRGSVIFDMGRWFALDDIGLIIGFTGNSVVVFLIARLLAGAGLLFWLYRRTKPPPPLDAAEGRQKADRVN